MKANEAPEKVYIPRLEGNKSFVHEWSATKFRKYFNREVAENVEYTRTDAFIEKALKFIKTNVDRIVNNQHGVCMGCMDKEFKEYINGE